MEKENKKKDEKKNFITTAILILGGVVLGYQFLKINSLKEELFVCKGEKKNLETLVRGLEKTLGNLNYQLGKLSTKRQ